MGLFYEVLSAINNPNQQASIDQLSSLSGSVQQLTNQYGIDNNTMQTVLSSLGGILGPALRQRAGGQSLEGMLGQLAGSSLAGSGGNFNPASLASLIPPQLQEQIIQTVAQKTGLSAGMLQGLIPALLPIVMNFLNMGRSTSGVQGSNPLLNAFLDSDRDGNTDLGDVMKFANRFLNAQYHPA